MKERIKAMLDRWDHRQAGLGRPCKLTSMETELLNFLRQLLDEMEDESNG